MHSVHTGTTVCIVIILNIHKSAQFVIHVHWLSFDLMCEMIHINIVCALCDYLLAIINYVYTYLLIYLGIQV